MPQKRKAVIRCAVTIATVLIIVSATRYSSMKIRDKLELQLQDTLQLVAEQNAYATEKELTATQSLLRKLAKELPYNPTDQIEQIIDMLQPFAEIYDLKRLGFISPDGTAYTTDGFTTDLSGEENFKASMDGKAYVTDVIDDMIGEPDKINVFSVPVYHQNGNFVSGVLFATYRTDTFHKLLDTECFDGQGYSCIMKQNGRLIVASAKSPFYGKENFYAAIRSLGTDNINIITEMEQQLRGRQTGLTTCVFDENHYIYYMPLDSSLTESQWYLLTIVPENVLSERLYQVFYYVNQLLGIVVIVLAAAFLYYLYSYWVQKKQLTTLAYIDPLTSGDNYACFKEKMQAKKGVHGYIISTDIYGFRIINNTCGTAKGNEVLQSVWKILRQHLTENELAAHIHADRFIFFLTDFEETALTERLEQINQDIAKLALELNTPRIMLYMGIYATDTPEDTEKGYGYANQAKHAVKNRMDKNYSFYEELNFQQHLEELKLEDGFEEAIQNHRFEVWYQPKYSTKDQKAVSAEALVRWRDVDGSLIPPFKFIPLFEKNGMISVLDEYVFQTVCAQQKQWKREGRTVLPVSVNISRSSLYYSNIVEKYEAILHTYDLPPECIELEITESAAVDNTDVQTLLDKFHEVGFRMLLDDFGNGYSSLATLNQMRFDTLKLDKSLVDGIGDHNGEILLHSIIKLAQNLGLKITAEGVEDKNQFEFLKQLECDDIQGYYFSKPLPLEEYQMLVYPQN